jgi:hypothetical protein
MPDEQSRVSRTRSKFNSFGVNREIDGPVEVSMEIAMSGKSRPQIATSTARRRAMPGQNHQGASKIMGMLSKSDREVVNWAPTTR